MTESFKDLSPEDIEKLKNQMIPYARKLLANMPRLKEKYDAEDFVQRLMEKELKKPQAKGPLDKRLVSFFKICLKRLILTENKLLKINKIISHTSLSAVPDNGFIEEMIVDENTPETLMEDAENPNEASRKFFAIIDRLNNYLEDIDWPAGNRKNGIDHFLILLLYVRIGIARKFGRSLEKEGETVEEIGGASMATFVETLIPWLMVWENRHIKNDPLWPTLGEWWEYLKDEVNRPPHDVDAKVLCEEFDRMIHEMQGPAFQITPGVLYIWLFRAKTIARENVKDDWDELFGTILPDNKTVGAHES